MNMQLDERIKAANLTKTEARVAEYISQHATNCCFMSALSLAAVIDTSDTSVIRTARKLGFNGYSDMQSFLSEFIVDEVERNGGINFLSPAAQVGKKIPQIRSNDLYQHMLEKITNNINDIFQKNTVESFNEASEIIRSSKRKVIMGFHGCAGVAQLLGGSLSDIYFDTQTVTSADSHAIIAATDITKTDCLIVVSFPRYAEMILTALSIAKAKSAKIIALTDRVTSPVSKMANVALLCGVDSITINNSYVAPTVVAEMLLATVYRNIGPAEQARLDEADRYITKYCMY